MTYIFKVCAHSERSASTYLFPDFSLAVFQSCSFQIPEHSTTPLVTAHESVSVNNSGHLSVQTKWTSEYTV